MALKIMLAGGGTGGHTYPLVAVAEELKKESQEQGIDIELRFIGAGDLLRTEASDLDIRFSSVISPKWRRYFSIKNFVGILLFPIGFIQAFISVWLYMPDVVFAKGGHASFLPLLTAKMMFIPIVIHESDAIPGKVNKIFGKLAEHVFVAFDVAKKYFQEEKTDTVGNPLRESTIKIVPKEEALATFGLDTSKPVLLVTGASQGAKVINDVFLLAIVQLVSKYHIIHQCGPTHFEEMNQKIATIISEEAESFGGIIKDSYRLFPSLTSQQLSSAFSAADIIIGRASSMIFEMAAAAKPSIVIPLKGSASDHQSANAFEFAKFGATVITEENLQPNLFLYEIDESYKNRTALAPKVREMYREDTRQVIAQYLLKFGP